MAIVLLLESDTEARIVKAKIKDGFIDIGGKQFFVDNAKPINLKKSMGGYKPLYILKWNSIEPAKNIHGWHAGWHNSTSKNPNPTGNPHNNPNNPNNESEIINPKFVTSELTPEMLKKMMGMKILGNMIKTKQEMPNIFLLIIGLVLGVAIMFSMVIMGVI